MCKLSIIKIKGGINMNFKIGENGFQTELDYGKLHISSNENVGFRPFQLMVASIVGCSGSVYLKILQKQRIEIEDMEISAKIDRNPNEANKIEKIHLNFVVTGNQLNVKKLQKSLEIARKNCAMVRSVEDSITIEETVEIKTP